MVLLIELVIEPPVFLNKLYNLKPNIKQPPAKVNVKKKS